MAIQVDDIVLNRAPSGGSSVVEITQSQWPSRGTGSEGDRLLVTDTGAYYEWSDTASEWIRPFIRSESITLTTRIDGTESSGSPPTGWSTTITGSGAITTDGEWVTFDDTAGADADRAVFEGFSGFPSAPFHTYACGYVRVLTAPGDNTTPRPSAVFQLDNDNRRLGLLFCSNGK